MTGSVVLLSGPFPTAALNPLVGGVFLAVGGVTHQIVASSGPDERRPDS